MNTHRPPDTTTDPYNDPERRRVPTLPIGNHGDQDRGPYHTELGVGAWFVIDARGEQVGNSYDDEALAQATADALNGMEPDAPTVEASR